MVSSTETVSTQSNGVFHASESSTSAVRMRILSLIRTISDGVKAGATVRRWPVCFDRSIAMNIGMRTSVGLFSMKSASVIPPACDE